MLSTDIDPRHCGDVVQDHAIAAHAPLSFLRLELQKLLDAVCEPLLKDLAAESLCVLEHGSACLWYHKLTWDSEYFGSPVYRIDLAFGKNGAALRMDIASAIELLKAHIRQTHTRAYLYAEVPAVDLALLQGGTAAGMSLVETRLHYYHDRLQAYEYPKRWVVRHADDRDIAELREVSASCVNRFDRFHADPWFGEQVANEFMAVFAENSVRGFADIVLVPETADEQGVGGFLTAKRMPAFDELAGTPVAHMVLSAVRRERAGWYLKLVSEMMYRLKAEGIGLVYLSTQASNRAVIRVWERLGFQYGRCTHVLAWGHDENART